MFMLLLLRIDQVKGICGYVSTDTFQYNLHERCPEDVNQLAYNCELIFFYDYFTEVYLCFLRSKTIILQFLQNF